jgi:hypothetical protein
MPQTQDLKHHARFHWPFHFVTGFLLLANLIAVVVHFVHHRGWWNGWLIALSVLIIFPTLLIRIYPLKVQDRLIRLEERLRLQELASAEWRPNIRFLTEDQLIGLRFAGDDEVITLARQAIDEKLTRKQIKERIRNWRADYFRV